MASHAAHDMHHDNPASHDKHAGHSVAMFRDRFWLSLALTIPIVLLSHDVADWLGYELPMVPWLPWIPAVLGTAVFLYGGLVFLRGAAGELRNRQPGMMTLISLAIVVAFVTSWAGTLGLFAVEIWWELATLITIMLLGHWLEMRSIAQARGALAALADLLPDTAERVTAAGTETVPLAALSVGDVVLVRPGSRVPADGEVAEGAADLDESLLTGESRPVAKGPGDPVVAGAVAAGGSLRVRVTATGDETALSGIVRHGGGGPGVGLARPGPRGPGGGPAVLRRPRARARSPSWPGGCSATPRARWSAPRPSWSSRAPTPSGSRSPW